MSKSPAVVAFRLEEIPWDEPGDDGTRCATIMGSRAAGELFTYAFQIPAGVWDEPHSHCAAAHLVVASGTLRLGCGPHPDRSRAVAYPAGSVLFVPAGAVHYDGAEEDTVLIGTAVGLWSTDYVQQQPVIGPPVTGPRTPTTC
jgi:quercetin dioxygenase-like cupin family protein